MANDGGPGSTQAGSGGELLRGDDQRTPSQVNAITPRAVQSAAGPTLTGINAVLRHVLCGKKIKTRLPLKIVDKGILAIDLATALAAGGAMKLLEPYWPHQPAFLAVAIGIGGLAIHLIKEYKAREWVRRLTQIGDAFELEEKGLQTALTGAAEERIPQLVELSLERLSKLYEKHAEVLEPLANIIEGDIAAARLRLLGLTDRIQSRIDYEDELEADRRARAHAIPLEER